MNNKPISIVIDDFRKDIAEVVNNSGLPFCIVEMIIKELYDESHMFAKQQLEIDRKNCAKALTEAEAEEE